MIEIKLSEQFIEMAENAILSDKLIDENNDLTPCISLQYYDDAEEGWNWINRDDISVTSYLLFASNAYGCTSYGFYKAKSGKIYIIQAYVNDIEHVFIPSKNIDCLKNVI